MILNELEQKETEQENNYTVEDILVSTRIFINKCLVAIYDTPIVRNLLQLPKLPRISDNILAICFTTEYNVVQIFFKDNCIARIMHNSLYNLFKSNRVPQSKVNLSIDERDDDYTVVDMFIHNELLINRTDYSTEKIVYSLK